MRRRAVGGAQRVVGVAEDVGEELVEAVRYVRGADGGGQAEAEVAEGAVDVFLWWVALVCVVDRWIDELVKYEGKGSSGATNQAMHAMVGVYKIQRFVGIPRKRGCFG